MSTLVTTVKLSAPADFLPCRRAAPIYQNAAAARPRPCVASAFRNCKVEVMRSETATTKLQQLSRVGDGASSSRGGLERREMIVKMMMVSGASILNFGGVAADEAHAAAGEVEGTPGEAANNPLIQQLLKRSRDNKAVYDKERLDDYYKRNFKEYFEFVEGSVRNKKELTPAEKAIVDWLAKNK